MRIGLIGKFPPIQGGVSMRTYWTAHRLAARGHDVHVVTNAKEVRPPYRMYMRAEDWARCEGDYGAGRVTVHWTDPVDRAQRYVPMASAFVSKLAGVAARVHEAQPFDVVFSHYLEPYGVAGHLAAEMVGVPHVVRMAGSDAGRLWHHPQLEALYDHVLRSAQVVLAVGPVARRAAARGVVPERIVPGGGFAPPGELFAPDGLALELASLGGEVGESGLGDLLWGRFAADRPYFGIYGKLGETKGSFALLAALARLVRAGRDVGLVAPAHGLPAVETRFRSEARSLGLEDRILQIPFLPHWRVPEFLRGCLAVCCLEQDFPIAVHNPIVPREVLLSGTCLVGTTEVLRKLPRSERLAHGYNCVAIRDVNDIDELSQALGAVLDNPAAAAAIGARGRNVALELQCDSDFPGRLETILSAAVRREPVPAVAALSSPPPAQARLVAALEAAVGEGGAMTVGDGGFDALFRLQAPHWALPDGGCTALVPFRDPTVRVVTLGGDFVVLRGGVPDIGRNPLVVDAETARILELCDGRRTVSQIASEIAGKDEDVLARRVAWIQRLFMIGLIGLREGAAASIRSP